MAQGDFMMQVRSNYNQFTKAERKVADYLLQHAQDVLFMSITDLADACKVGETTVFRFCKTMKLQGYQEFKIKVSLSIKGEEEEQPLLEDVNKDDNLVVLTQKLLNSNGQRNRGDECAVGPPEAPRGTSGDGARQEDHVLRRRFQRPCGHDGDQQIPADHGQSILLYGFPYAGYGGVSAGEAGCGGGDLLFRFHEGLDPDRETGEGSGSLRGWHYQIRQITAYDLFRHLHPLRGQGRAAAGRFYHRGYEPAVYYGSLVYGVLPADI